MNVVDFCWPIERLGDALEELACSCGLTAADGHSTVSANTPPAATPEQLGRWLEWAGERLGIEAEPVETTVAELDGFLRHAGPSIVRIPSPAGDVFLLLLRARRGTLTLLCPDLRHRRCSAAAVRGLLSERFAAPLATEIDRVLDLAQLDDRDRSRARQALLAERIGGERIAGAWLLRLPASAGFWRQLVHDRLPHRLVGVVGVFAALYAFEIFGWGLVGNAILSGRLDFGWLRAWVLILLTLVPLALLGGWLNATFALGAGRIMKRRLLAGALNVDLDSMRHQGIGQLLSRVMESQALEALAVNGGMSVLVSAIELTIAVWVLWMGASGGLLATLLVVWLAVSVAVVLRYTKHMRSWTLMRLGMTHELLERMVGHRTILAQEWPWRRDARADASLHAYQDASHRLDRVGVAVFAGIPGGWGILGLLGLAPAFVAGDASPAALAIAFGGLLLSTRAFGGIALGVSALAGAAIAWDQVGPLFRAGSSATGTNTAPLLPSVGADLPAEHSQRLIDASRIVFRHPGQREPVLNGVTIAIARGERILLEGPSGAGKSSLASLLVGLRQPESGLLLLDGLDRATLGTQWHRLATEAPQFHENHILSGPLGFNLLMGRNWPAHDEELAQARRLLEELGLGELLARMPSGMLQTVGETGWQLSHGERSRIFLARALLQEAELTVMDESFAALDPETLARCLDCVFERARTLVVIAHP